MKLENKMNLSRKGNWKGLVSVVNVGRKAKETNNTERIIKGAVFEVASAESSTLSLTNNDCDLRGSFNARVERT